MKIFFNIILGLLIFYIPKLSNSKIISNSLGDHSGDTLAWSEEFNYNGSPDKNKWDFELGLIRKGEKQYYSISNGNAIVKNGFLYIIANKEMVTKNKFGKIDTVSLFTSASLVSKNKESWKYGKFVVRAKLPKGRGGWPAIWLMGTNHDIVDWPNCGEIDLMEFVGKDPFFVHSNIHYPYCVNNKSSISNNNGSFYSPNLLNGFHVYEMDWNEDFIKFFVDGVFYHKVDIKNINVDGANPFHKPFYLIINLALGGKWGGDIDLNSFPMKFVIDYIRIYK